MKTMKVVLVVAVVMAWASISQADFITNGGFETGTLAGWTLVGGSANVAAYSSFGGMAPRSGQYFAATNYLYDTNWASQVLATGHQGTLVGYVYLPSVLYTPSVAVVSSDGHWGYIMANQWGDGMVDFMRDGWGDAGSSTIAVTPSVWHEVKFVAGASGLSAYWDGQAIWQNWATFTDIKEVRFGSSWNTSQIGYDDFSFVPEPATLGLLLMGGLVGWARRRK